jgi:RNA polymerase sigma-70 factor, ECF subfamily
MIGEDKTPEDPVMDAVAGVIGTSHEAPLEALADAITARRGSLAWLLETARSGDADAFAAMVRQFQGPTYHFILRMVRRPAVAEDLSQDVFIRLWRHLAEIQSADLLPGWLRRVAANAVIDHWRKDEARERRLQVLREHPVARFAVKPSSRMESQEALDIVHAALEELPAKLRTVLLLRTQENLSYEEVADVLGMSVHAVRSRLFRARQELHSILKRKKAADYLARMYQMPHGPMAPE